MMPPEMMRSAAPDFGDHGREIGPMTRSGTMDRTNGRSGWPRTVSILFLVRLGLDRRRGSPHDLTI